MKQSIKVPVCFMNKLLIKWFLFYFDDEMITFVDYTYRSDRTERDDIDCRHKYHSDKQHHHGILHVDIGMYLLAAHQLQPYKSKSKQTNSINNLVWLGKYT